MSSSLTRRIAALTLGAMTSLGIAGVLASPAHALTFTATVSQRQASGLVGFTYDANTGVVGARNVNAMAANATPGGMVHLRVHDASNSSNPWYQTLVTADSLGRANITVTGLPASACGHTLTVSVIDYGSNTYITKSMTENCGPMVNLTQNGSIIGDGFTAGSTASIHVSGASQTVRVTTTGYWTTIFGNRVFVKTTPGQVASTLRPPQYTYYSGHDLTTGRTDTQYYF